MITPREGYSPYRLIVGEDGIGKTGLIELALKGLKEPKGVVYVNVPDQNDSAIPFVKTMQQALGYKPPKFDSKGN
jgi:hypothetical protein